MSDEAVPTPLASVDDLLAADLDDSRVVVLPKLGRSVRIRGLTRDEAIKIADTKGSGEREKRMVTWAMVEPELTYQQVEAWFRKASAGDLQFLTAEIAKQSGLTDEAEKESFARFREESGA